ncbi:sodium/glutamate symporter [Falsihalocynthiibacter sp. SS001]|uniref:sodium/glutamate symporter n=1 Tax=Falsihalocynthiibacter sp. SS001 TaxID=3349698 RepID=UPI0036D320A6
MSPDLHEIETIFSALALLFLFLVLGLWARRRFSVLERLFIPGSVIAGLIVLLLGTDVLGAVSTHFAGEDSLLSDGLFGQELVSIWRGLPSLLINIVFACLFLGKSLPHPREIWSQSAPVLCYGQTIAWGQYVIGLTLALLVLTPVFGMDPMVGALIEIGFEGGHGTAAGLAPVFESLNFEEGIDLALGLASVGLLSAILSGIVLINIARRKGLLIEDDAIPEHSELELETAISDDQDTSSEDHSDLPIDPMSFTLGLVAASIAFGAVILETLQFLERILWGRNGLELMAHVPLFPMAMIGGAIVQMIVQRIWGKDAVDQVLIKRTSGVALDLIIIAALGTLSLSVIANNFGPFIILAVAGVSWNILGFLWLAPRLIPGPWFQRGIPNFGQSMGMTVTGIMLFQMADPNNRSGGLERFAYKQLLFEPFVGGGLFTAMSLPLIAEFGPVAILILTAVLMVFWGFLGFRIARASAG